MARKVGIPTEVLPDETRVSATPDSVSRLIRMGFEVLVQAGAGQRASFPDAAYAEAGATVLPDAPSVWEQADIITRIHAPSDAELGLLRPGKTLISFLWPAQNPELLEALKTAGVTAFAMDCVPRITRAQKLDALSSMANIAGYRAIVEAANHFGRFFTGQITAAGKVPPARVLVIGAGVAGLAAIGAARGLGAVVSAFDTREAVKEQVESMGGQFLLLDFEEDGDGGGGYAKVMSKEFIEAEMALFREQAPKTDIVITTALIPGRPAPKLWMKDMVELMPEGGVVVDLAARNGGNCELTEPGKVVRKHGVSIVGHPDLTQRLPSTASQLYGTNICHLLDDMGKEEGYRVDLEDEVVRGALVTHESEIMWPPPKPKPKPKPQKKAAPKPPAPKAEPKPAPAEEKAPEPQKEPMTGVFVAAGLLLAWVLLKLTVSGETSTETAIFLQHLTVFVLSCFIGWQVVWNVTPALHTPLMSVTNAISGIIIVGGMLQAKGGLTDASTLLGAAAILLATINIAGGFLVTERMLKMFRR